MHETTVTLGELVSILFENFVDTFGDEELAAHATAVTVGRWFVRRADARCRCARSQPSGEHEIEA